MALDSYVKIDGIDGQSTDKGHDKWIDVGAFQLGSLQNVTAGRAVESSGRGDILPFVFVHVVDKASPKLQEACISGKNIKTVEFHICVAVGGAQVPTLEVKMEEVKIIRAEMGGLREGFKTEGDGVAPMEGQMIEQVSMVPGKITWKVTPIKPDGSKDGAVETKWNVLANSAS